MYEPLNLVGQVTRNPTSQEDRAASFVWSCGRFDSLGLARERLRLTVTFHVLVRMEYCELVVSIIRSFGTVEIDGGR
jgi:hypothetical protein